jgi:hypothetical protein
MGELISEAAVIEANNIEVSETGIAGFTFEDAGMVVIKSGIEKLGPENTSDFSTVIGISKSANKYKLSSGLKETILLGV